MTPVNPPTSVWPQVILNNHLVNLLAFTQSHLVPSLSALDSKIPAESLRPEPNLVLLFSPLQPLIHFTGVKGTWKQVWSEAPSPLCLSDFCLGASSAWPKRCSTNKRLPYYHPVSRSTWDIRGAFSNSSLCQVIFGLSPQPRVPNGDGDCLYPSPLDCEPHVDR